MTATLVAHADLASTARRMKDWLLNEAAPLWAERGRTPSGLFAERISQAGEPDDSYFRSFVQARHIYSFVAAGKLGWTGPWATLVHDTADTLLSRARRPDGFFAHRLDRSADILDGRADLYDQAFILFAFGTAGGALGREDLFDAAESLLDTIESHWSHPEGGFTEGEIVDASIRRQNPHMHLFEAFLALEQASGRARFTDAAVSIARLCQQHFLDRKTGALREYFDQDWRPRGQGAQRDGDVVEPGHCSEWAWLFERLAAKGWADGVAISDRLVGFARAHGIDQQRGVMIDEVWIDGTPKSTRARCWPQTERAKAAVARWRRSGADSEADEAVAAIEGLRPYLTIGKPGLWHDKLHADGRWEPELAPGSSLYHISCAISEIATALD